jgi:putative tryptophan/tyrosine transport system substrate-binding protein
MLGFGYCTRSIHGVTSMRRREFTSLLGAVFLAPVAAKAQQVGRTYRLGVLLPHPRDVPVNVAFIEEFRRHGFIEGENLVVEWRAYWQHVDLISQYAAELVKARVDVITTAGDEAMRAAQQATKTIPIVGLVDDMLGTGLVNSLARPDGNTTGVSILAVDLDGKRQEILIEAVPGLRRVAALADVNDNFAATKFDALRAAARARNVELSIYRIAKGDEITAAIDRAQASGVTAINIFASPILWANRQLIMDRATALHMPTIHIFPEEAEEGGFAAYGPRLGQLFVEVMPQQIIKLFRGIKVADIPVEQPTKFELVINLKTAKAMGVTVPPALLLRANNLIE